MSLKPGVILVILALVAVGVFGGMTVFTTEGSWTAGEIEHHKGWEGQVILSDSHYTTSWKHNGESEDVTVQGKVRLVDYLTPYHDMDKYRYIAYYQGTEIKRFPTGEDNWLDWPDATIWPWDTGDWFHGQAWTFNFRGELSGQLEVKMECKIGAYWPWNDWTGVMARDGARLESGRCLLELYNSQGPFEEGSDAVFRIETGFSNGAGFDLKLYCPASRPNLFSPNPRIVTTIGDDKHTHVSIRIEEGWFSPTGNPLDNMFEVELWNNVLQTAEASMFVVDFLDRIPGPPRVTSVNNGDSFTYTITSEVTYANIDSFLVFAYYTRSGITQPPTTDTESWILYAQTFPATVTGGNATATFVVTPKNFDGMIVVKAMAADVDGRVSEPSITTFKVEDGKTKDFKTFSQAFLWTLMVSMVILLGLLISALLLIRSYMAGSVEMGVVWFAVGMVITFIIAYIVGATPSLALLLG